MPVTMMGRPRGAMSTLFALEGVNFFDAFTFEVFGRWDGCRFFCFLGGNILVTQKKSCWTFWKGGTLQHFLRTDFFWTPFFWKAGTLKFQ